MESLHGWGMVAGCVSATRELKAYMKDALMQMVVTNPAIETEAWIDDITLEAENDDAVVVEATRCKATRDLRQLMIDDCSLEFAEPKTAVVVSRDRLAAAIASKVGDPKVPRQGQTPNHNPRC